jgi:hypothetical protein
MKAFISYTIGRSNQYQVTLLVEELSRVGVSVTSSHDCNGIETLIKGSIQRSDIFIGLISSNDNMAQSVIQEWKIAKSIKKPYLLLVEESFELNGSQSDSRVISYSRNNPKQVLAVVNRIIAEEKNKQDSSTAMALVLGGTALYALFKILGDKGKR